MVLATPSHYDVLEIPVGSGDSEVKKAFHGIARKHHPDRAADGDVELFKRATVAYETLVDPERRRNYDLELKTAEPWRWQAPQDGTRTGFMPSSPLRGESSTTRFFNAAFAQPFTSAEATAAATAAFHSDSATYRRRPQKTRFSTRSSPPASSDDSSAPREEPRKPNKDAHTPNASNSSRPRPSTVPHAERESRHKQRDPHGTSAEPADSKKRRKGSPDEAEPVQTGRRHHHKAPENAQAPGNPHSGTDAFEDEAIDLTGESPADPGWNRPASKRQASSEESPSKRKRTFDFSDMRQVPPFTQKHGTSFTFADVNEAINSIDGDSRRNRSADADHWPRSPPNAREYHEYTWDPYKKTVLEEFTAESTRLLNRLIQIHNARLQALKSVHPDPDTVAKNLAAQEDDLTQLLRYTRGALETLDYTRTV